MSEHVEVDRAEYEQFLEWREAKARQDGNLQTVRAVFAAEAEGDAEAFFAPFSSDSEFWMNAAAPDAGTLHGVAAQKAAFEHFISQLVSGISMNITHALAAGDWVVTETEGTAETLDGRPYNAQYCQLWKFDGAEIVKMREYLDTKLLAETFASE
jgi:ketosteroid isomerase-like protein